MNSIAIPSSARLVLLALAISGMSAPSLAGQKFDAGISAAMARADTTSGEDATAKSGLAPGTVRILVRYSDDKALDAIRKAGGTVRSVLGNIASVEVPASALAAVAAIPEIEYMEAEKKLPQRLNKSVTATRADLLRSGSSPNLSGATGAGVIVGIVDDGLDFRHLDFRNADGSTRLLGLWDQRASGAAGSPPAGYSYGGECTVQMINDAIKGNAGCTQPSTGNHGTHVGSIAIGNGQQTGEGQAPYRFVGMAPKADILAANSIVEGVGNNSNAVVDAVAWMKAKAAALGKPLVINLSLGSYFGARDGTSNFEQALSNAAGSGVIITAAAGNEGGDKLVASGVISTGEIKTVTFAWPSGQTGNQKVEMWYPGIDRYSVRLIGPNGCAMPDFLSAGFDGNYTLPCGTISVSSTRPQANNDDRQILVTFQVDPANPGGFQGDWTYQIRGDQVANAETPFSLICGEDESGLLFTSNTPSGPTMGILTDTSSATRTIAVTAYNTNYTWLTTGGVPSSKADRYPVVMGPLTDLSSFSSRGPRRYCSNIGKCPGSMKPEIAAPGAMIMAAFGQDAKQPSDVEAIEVDGKHIAYNGTSMATPHVTGAVALMLQKNPALTPEQVKQILFQNVQANSFTTALPTFNPNSPLMPANPNFHWGYGILDAQAAYNAVTSGGGAPTPIPATTLNAIEYFHTGFGHYFVTASTDEAAAIDRGAVQGWARTGQTFKVYPLDASGSSSVCRFFSTTFAPKSSHFYTPSAAECSVVKSNPNWQYEGLVFSLGQLSAGACPAGTGPLYRAYNNGLTGAPNHRYSTSSSIISTMTGQGWVSEGVIACVPN